MMNRWKDLLRTGLALSASLVLACGPEGMEDQEEEAVEGAGEIAAVNQIGSSNSSDPSVRVFGETLYVYTSSDLDQPQMYYGNAYPMDTTYVYALKKGKKPGDLGNWARSVVLNESQLPWVTSGSWHMWAPDAVRQSRTSGKYYLYVPDVEGMNNFQSRISVSSSSSPTGPFTVEGQVTFDGSVGGPTGYASDPHVLIYSDGNRGTNRYMVFADGDNDSCGGFHIGKLSSDMKTVTDVRNLEIQGIPPGWIGDRYFNERGELVGDTCDTNLAKGISEGPHPYIEGASLYYLTKATDSVNSNDRPFYLIFPVKPNGDGQEAQFPYRDNRRNQVIAYARASSVWGPYRYQGVIMESQGDWTNQASIAKWGSNWLFFYHSNNPDKAGSPNKNRRVRAECLNFDNNGNILTVSATEKGLACATGYPR